MKQRGVFCQTEGTRKNHVGGRKYNHQKGPIKERDAPQKQVEKKCRSCRKVHLTKHNSRSLRRGGEGPSGGGGTKQVVGDKKCSQEF